MDALTKIIEFSKQLYVFVYFTQYYNQIVESDNHKNNIEKYHEFSGILNIIVEKIRKDLDTTKIFFENQSETYWNQTMKRIGLKNKDRFDEIYEEMLKIPNNQPISYLKFRFLLYVKKISQI